MLDRLWAPYSVIIDRVEGYRREQAFFEERAVELPALEADVPERTALKTP